MFSLAEALERIAVQVFAAEAEPAAFQINLF